jgi:hypothetical protein
MNAARRKTSTWRLLNAIGAVVIGLSTLVLAADWLSGGGSVWWVVGGGLVTAWCAWDAIPRRRRGQSVPPDRR